jgi:sensor histidine kinase regulating citrate/malate metabolism
MPMKESWRRLEFRIWLAVVGSATLVLGAAYALTQQSTRLAVDDLPLATAQSVKHQLENSASASEVVPQTKTNLKEDSTVFVIVTDKSQQILASSAQINGKTPLPPKGVFDFTAVHSKDQITWAIGGARLAITVLNYDSPQNSGYIIAGQSLSQAEDRINTYGMIALVAWIVMLVWTSVVLLWNTGRKG